MRQRAIKLLLFLTLLFSPVAIFTPARDSFLIKDTLTLIFISLALVLWSVSFTTEKFIFVYKNLSWLDLSILFYLATILLSIGESRKPYLVFSTFVLQLMFTGVYFLAKEIYDREKMLTAVCISGWIVCLYGLLQYFGYDFIHWVTDFGRRPSSFFGNPNFFAGYLVVLLPIAMVRWKNFYWSALAILSLINLLLTKTRGAWLASIVSIVLMIIIVLYKETKIRAMKKTFLIVVSTILFLVIFFFTTFIWKSFISKEPSVVERLFKWQTAIEMIKDKPIFGLGAGNLKVNFALYQSKIRKRAHFIVRGTSESNVHNEFFQIAAETGLLGLGAFLCVFIAYFISMIKALKQEISITNVGYVASVAAFLSFCLTNFPLRISSVASLTFLCMAFSTQKNFITTATQKYRSTENPFTKPRLISPLTQVILFGIYIFLIWKVYLPPLIAEVYRQKGAILMGEDNFLGAITAYKKAIEYDYYRSERTAYDLGELYRHIDDIDNAIQAYKISINLRNYGEVYNCLGNCYWLKGNIDDAINNWQKALELGLPDPKDIEIVQRNISLALKKLHKHETQILTK